MGCIFEKISVKDWELSRDLDKIRFCSLTVRNENVHIESETLPQERQLGVAGTDLKNLYSEVQSWCSGGPTIQPQMSL